MENRPADYSYDGSNRANGDIAEKFEGWAVNGEKPKRNSDGLGSLR